MSPSRHHRCVLLWSKVRSMSLSRKAVCVGTALCSCRVLPSGLRGCAGNTLLIHLLSPSGISKMGPMASAGKQPDPPSLSSAGERRGHGRQEVKMQASVRWGCSKGGRATLALCFRMCTAKCCTKKDVLRWYPWSPGMPEVPSSNSFSPRPGSCFL